MSCLPVSGLESFVREIERLVQSSSPFPPQTEVGIDNGTSLTDLCIQIGYDHMIQPFSGAAKRW